MRFLSVCSGIEAASVAWSPLGWRAGAFSEIEPFPCSLLAHHYPDVPNLGDMTKYRDWPDGAIDLLCGGTPCQSFSVAGLRAGLDDPRGNLMLTFGAIAARYRPRWLVWENVPGVLSSNDGRDFGSFLWLLGQLGYGFAYRVLDAQHFGVPQRRRRVFVVGCLGDWRAAAAVLFERHSLQGHPAPRREAGKGVASGVIKGAAIGRQPHNGPQYGDAIDDGSCYTLTTNEVHAVAFGGNNTAGPIDVATALNACASASGRMDFESETFIASLDLANMGDGGNVGFHLADKPTITLDCNGNIGVCHALTGEGFDASEDGTGRGTPSLDKSKTPAVGYGMQVRRLTPREAERLQGFPDDYTLIPHRGKPAADGPRYKALGNSWAVPVVRWIGQRIDAVEGVAQMKEAA